MVLTGPTSTPTTSPARRLQRPSWRDHRLLIGVILVLASVALGARTVAAADHTEPYFAARATLATGTELTAADVTVVRARISGSSTYLDARHALPTGRVLTHAVGAGELIPLSATVAADALALRPVSIPVDGGVPAGLSAGGRVDLWASNREADGGNGYLPPQRIAEQVEVSHVQNAGDGLGSGRSASVQVLLAADALPRVLDALANEARIALLPLPGTPEPGQEAR